MIKLREVPVLRVWMLKKQSEGGKITKIYKRSDSHLDTKEYGTGQCYLDVTWIEG